MTSELPIHCPCCGVVLEDLQARVNELESTIQALGVEVARKQGTINRLRKEQNAIPPDLKQDALEVAEYWKDTLYPRARELNGPRLAAVVDRLKHGYTVEDLKRAIDGYRRRPCIKMGRRVPPGQGDLKVDLGYLMQDANHVDVGLEIADIYDPPTDTTLQLPL